MILASAAYRLIGLGASMEALALGRFTIIEYVKAVDNKTLVFPGKVNGT